MKLLLAGLLLLMPIILPVASAAGSTTSDLEVMIDWSRAARTENGTLVPAYEPGDPVVGSVRIVLDGLPLDGMILFRATNIIGEPVELVWANRIDNVSSTIEVGMSTTLVASFETTFPVQDELIPSHLNNLSGEDLIPYTNVDAGTVQFPLLIEAVVIGGAANGSVIGIAAADLIVIVVEVETPWIEVWTAPQVLTALLFTSIILLGMSWIMGYFLGRMPDPGILDYPFSPGTGRPRTHRPEPFRSPSCRGPKWGK